MPDCQGSIPVIQDCQGSIPVIPDCQGSIPVIPDCQESIPVIQDCQESIPVIQDCQGSIPVIPDCQGSIPVIQDCQRSTQQTVTVSKELLTLCLLVGCLLALRPSSMLVYFREEPSQTRYACHHTEIEKITTFYLTESQYTNTPPTSHSADTIGSGAWQGSH